VVSRPGLEPGPPD